MCFNHSRARKEELIFFKLQFAPQINKSVAHVKSRSQFFLKAIIFIGTLTFAAYVFDALILKIFTMCLQ